MSHTGPGGPNGRCAVALTFDNFGESLDLLHHGHAGGALADGVYAPRRGVGRVLDLLDRHRIRGTFFVEGWNARKYASLLKDVAARGHEVGCHGWMHEAWNTLGPDQERDLIWRATETVGEVLGHAPAGWRSPGGLITPRTLGLLHEAGYRYDSSFADEDVPYLMRIDAERSEEIVELPWSWSLDDAVYYGHPGVIRRPAEVLQLWIDEFDAARKLTDYFMLVCHPRFSGRPARIEALERLVEHVEAQEGVWFASCQELAEQARLAPTTPRYPAPESFTG